MQGEKRFVNEVEVAKLTGFALPTLRNMRSMKTGIPFYKLKKAVRYRLDEVIAWVETHRVETEEG